MMLLPRHLPELLQPVGSSGDFGVLGIPGNPIAAQLPPERGRDVRKQRDGKTCRLLQQSLCCPADLRNDAAIPLLRVSIHGSRPLKNSKSPVLVGREAWRESGI